jgi:Ser/Thr protein kinase RdoA (MazF antagonist)
LLPAPLVTAHRDFHPEQVLIDGSQAYVLDLDLACMAPYGLDGGNMLAHLVEARLRGKGIADSAIAAFETAASAGAASALPPVLPVWTTLALARLIEIASRLPGREPAVEPLLALVEHRLDNPHSPAAACLDTSPCLEGSR